MDTGAGTSLRALLQFQGLAPIVHASDEEDLVCLPLHRQLHRIDLVGLRAGADVFFMNQKKSLRHHRGLGCRRQNPRDILDRYKRRLKIYPEIQLNLRPHSLALRWLGPKKI